MLRLDGKGDNAEHVRRLDSAAGSLSLARCVWLKRRGEQTDESIAFRPFVSSLVFYVSPSSRYSTIRPTSRKCLRLFGPIPHLNALIQPTPLPASAFFNTILALLTACADDVFCLSRLGLVSKRTGGWADKWAKYVPLPLPPSVC